MVFREIIKFLVVDADKTNGKYLRGALQSLGCQVTTCKYQEQALLLLSDQKREFDIVVADVNIPYEMGLKFVDIVSSKMNIPIIIMSSASNKEIIAAGINLGICEVAVKPVGMDDVRRFCQFALEHRRQHLLGVGNSASNSEEHHGQVHGSNQGTIQGRLNKDRFVWTEDLKALFVVAVHALGGKNIAVPRKIMELMNVPNLTREIIASHLQKYRLHSYPNYVGGKRKRKAAQAMLVNGMDMQPPVVAYPNRRVLSFEAPEFAPNAQNVFIQQLLGQTDGIRSKETPTTLDSELESFLAMDLSDLDFPFFVEYPPQDMSMLYGGQSNSLHDNNYKVGQSEMGNGDLSSLNDRITNDLATRQQEQIVGSSLEQPGSFSGLGTSDSSTLGQGTSEPSTFGQGTRNGCLVWSETAREHIISSMLGRFGQV